MPLEVQKIPKLLSLSPHRKGSQKTHTILALANRTEKLRKQIVYLH